MAGLNRTNIAGFFWSGVCNTLILGGIVWGLGVLPQARELGFRSEPLVVDLIPLKHAQSDRAQAEPVPAARPPGAAGDSVAIQSLTKSASLASPVQAVGLSSELTGQAHDISGKPETVASNAQRLSEYQRLLNELIAQNTRYPAEARRLRLAGITHLAFSLDRSGRVLSSWIATSSGAGALDAAALEGLERAEPLPPIPPGLPEQLNFVVEIDSSIVASM